MTTWTRNFSLAMSVAILCSGCLAALLTVDTPKVELTKLKSIADEIDIFFADNKALYTNANQTIEEFERLPEDYGLTNEEYTALTESIIDGDGLKVPSRLDEEKRGKVKRLSQNVQSLRNGLMNTGQRAQQTAAFIMSKSKDLEAELVILRSNHEVVKRNPLASQREKNRSANQIRAANKLIKDTLSKAEVQRKELATLQGSGVVSLKKLMMAFKTAGVATGAAASAAARERKEALSKGALEGVEGAASELTSKASKQLDSAIETADEQMSAGQQQLDNATNKLSKKAQKSRSDLKNTTDAAKKKVDEESSEAATVLDERVKSLTNSEPEESE